MKVGEVVATFEDSDFRQLLDEIVVHHRSVRKSADGKAWLLTGLLSLRKASVHCTPASRQVVEVSGAKFNRLSVTTSTERTPSSSALKCSRSWYTT